MDKYFIKCGYGQYATYSVEDGERLRRVIAITNESVSEIMKSIQTHVVINPHESNWVLPNDFTNIFSEHGRCSIRDQSNVANLTSGDVDKSGCLKYTLNMITCQSVEFKRKLESNTLTFNDQMIRLVIRSSAEYNMEVIKVVDAIQCDKCDAVIPDKDVVKHEREATCVEGYAHSQARKADYVIHVRDRGTVKAIRRAGVDSVLISEHITVAIPQWVNDAISAYRDNNGFAGLTLEEYLEKMKADNGR